ncbi:MAG: hypothetical protein WBB19_08980 [Desulforhopalus sp.]
MNYRKTVQKLGTSLVMAAAFTFVASPSFARVDLVAIEGTWTPAGGSPITMWGFVEEASQACDSNPTWTVGPEITAADLQNNGNLRIRLRNCLSQAVSIVIPGQKAAKPGGFPTPKAVRNGDGRIVSFTTETPALGTMDYLWENVAANEGTFLYMSGSHPALQVHMGLYGALNVGTYANTSGDVSLLYSEIDPALHDPTPTAATPLTYNPSYFLVNGQEDAPVIAAGDTVQPTVIRFLNAGLDFHIPAISSGDYMSLQAEDGNLYPFAKTQYSVNLAAGKTIEALWLPTADGEHLIYDRRGNGLNAKLTVDTP